MKITALTVKGFQNPSSKIQLTTTEPTYCPTVSYPLSPNPYTLNFAFSAKERDAETGLSVTSLRSVSSSSLNQTRTSSVWYSLVRRFGARYYNSDLLNMGMRRLLIFFMLLFSCWCGQSQNDSYCEARLLSVKDSSVLSFCDSIISYAQECFESPMWYKFSVNFETDTLHLFGTAVQYLDSQYYANNQYWLQNSIFMFDSLTPNVFVYSDKIFEIVNRNFPESVFALTDSTIQLPLWLSNASPVFISKDIKFPVYYQCLGLISATDKKITIVDKRCSRLPN